MNLKIKTFLMYIKNLNTKQGYILLSSFLLSCYLTAFICLYEYQIYLDYEVFKVAITFDTQFADDLLTYKSIKQKVTLDNLELTQEIAQKSLRLKDLQDNFTYDVIKCYLGSAGTVSIFLGLVYYGSLIS